MDEITTTFKRHGALKISPTWVDKDLLQVRNGVNVLLNSGAQLTLPHDLRQNYIRYLARLLSQPENFVGDAKSKVVKRYDIGDVFRHDNLDPLPKQRLLADFDIVMVRTKPMIGSPPNDKRAMIQELFSSTSSMEHTNSEPEMLAFSLPNTHYVPSNPLSVSSLIPMDTSHSPTNCSVAEAETIKVTLDAIKATTFLPGFVAINYGIFLFLQLD